MMRIGGMGGGVGWDGWMERGRGVAVSCLVSLFSLFCDAIHEGVRFLWACTARLCDVIVGCAPTGEKKARREVEFRPIATRHFSFSIDSLFFFSIMDAPPDVGTRRRSLDVRSASYAQLAVKEVKDVEGGRPHDAGAKGAGLRRSDTDFGDKGGMDVAVKVWWVGRRAKIGVGMDSRDTGLHDGASTRSRDALATAHHPRGGACFVN